MRTQLLHVVPAIDHEESCDCGTAANDESAESEIVTIRPVLSLTAAPDTLTLQPARNRNAADSNDEYWLGGYAGI
jgi:hypothetical protein